MSNWQKIKDPDLNGVFLSKDTRVVEVIHFKDYGNTYFVYGWEGKSHKASKGFQGQDLAKKIALEWLNGNDEVLKWDN